MTTKRIDLDAVEVGMFISELDIPWFESPFLNPYRHVKDINDVTLLRDCGVKQVTIDLTRSTHIKPDTAPKLSVSQEMRAATRVRDKARQVLDTMHQDIKNGKAVETEQVKEVLDHTVESLTRNNQALMTLLHMNHKASKIADHAFSVMCLAVNVAMELNLNAEQQEELALAALLHDSGWQKLPLNLIGKRSKYSASEKALVQHHVKLGIDLLANSGLSDTVKRLILEHHERGDGSGFPQKLKQAQLSPLSSLLIAVVYYDEQVHQMGDDAGQTPKGTLQSMYSMAQKGVFDSKIVSTLVHLLGVYPISSAVQLDSGEKALVIEQDPNSHANPIIVIKYDANGRPHKDEQPVALANDRRKVVKVLDPKNPEVDPNRLLVIEV